jgi:hypothetical protein
MARDPKSTIVDGRKRLLTIHDGARLTPALVRILEGLADEANEKLELELDRQQSISLNGRDRARRAIVPVLVARSDGLAVYVDPDGGLA